MAVFLYAGILDQKGRALAEEMRKVGVTVRTSNSRTMLSKSVVPFRLARLFRTFKPDIVHSHLDQSDFLTFLAAQLWVPKQNVRFVRTIHNVVASKVLPKWAHNVLSHFFDTSVACGAIVRSTFPYLVNCKSDVIGNGIQILSDRLQSGTGLLRSKIGVPEEAVVLINIGSFNERNGVLQKAQDVIVSAMVRLRRTNVHMVFIGDGEQRPRLVDEAIRLGVGEQVHFLGAVSNPLEYVCDADLVVFPSRFEGLSIACIEAACCGKPLILSDIGAFQPFFGASAIVVEKGSVEALVAGIGCAMERLQELRKSAVFLQDKFREEFDIARVADKYLAIYGENYV